MIAATSKDWQKDFGLDERTAPGLFATADVLGTARNPFPQAHVLRRAFDLLHLDGVLCAENSPLVYFKQMASLDDAKVSALHRQFWNHGGAPLLVLIAPTEVRIYSGLARPIAVGDDLSSSPGLVERLSKSSDTLREFLPAVESGEFFRRHPRSFNPEHRVDRALLENLEATRNRLSSESPRSLDPQTVDALLCRLVFTCYLFDRDIIGANYLAALGMPHASHLRDILGGTRLPTAKSRLYKLFRQLGADFNGDLFSDDLADEEASIPDGHISPLNDFFRGTDVHSGQRSLWPYDFGVIPVETISAIYEQFLRQSDKQAGAFYTPRFLAEVVLDVALAKTPTLRGRQYLDPACGSGIFLVGLFNRIAEEWKEANPGARNDRRARELMTILRESLFGIDTNPTACRITAFSLYLAYLDQLSPRDIQALQHRGRALPKLVRDGSGSERAVDAGNIVCGDFFTESDSYPRDVHLVVGNPPWGSIAVRGTPAAAWCEKHGRLIPDMQIAAAFIWKAPEHVTSDGEVCLVLPVGTLFNQSKTAINFQRSFLTLHAVDTVLNLADYQRFLFGKAEYPALVVAYRKTSPSDNLHEIRYWSPKADWLATRAEIITISSDDQAHLQLRDVLSDLDTEDAPQIWKRKYWATSRDRRLLDRLSSYPRLRDQVRKLREDAPHKPWVMAVGFQPVNESDDPRKAKAISLPSKLFIPATSREIDLFLIPSDCTTLRAATKNVRGGSNTDTSVFNAPHVLIAKGFTSAAFAGFACSFQDALRGISGPESDRDLLVFLAAYLRSPLAKYFLFHTSSNWGVNRQVVNVGEMLRLPFPLPSTLPDPQRAWEIVRSVAASVINAADRVTLPLANREEIVRATSESVEPLIGEYFDLLPDERLLIDDTVRIIVPSARPTRRRDNVPTITPSTPTQRAAYLSRLCHTLNQWATKGHFMVSGRTIASSSVGIGLTVLEKVTRHAPTNRPSQDSVELLEALDKVRRSVSRQSNTIEIARGVKVFDGNKIYIVKPIAQRFWTQTAALNDADEIAGTILMQTTGGAA